MRAPIKATITCADAADACDQLELWARSYGIDVITKNGDVDQVELTFGEVTAVVDYTFLQAFLTGVRWAQFGAVG